MEYDTKCINICLENICISRHLLKTGGFTSQVVINYMAFLHH